MDTIYRQISAAQRRLVLQRFGRIITWSMFALLIVAAIGAAVPKIWALPVSPEIWLASWAGGAAFLAALVAAIVTYWTRPSLADTAIEVDRRFGLRERLSSTLALDHHARETEIGRALIADATQRAEKIAISERFAMQPARRGLLPLLPIVFLVLLIFIPNATRENVADASAKKSTQAEAAQVKTAAQQLKKRLEQQRRQAEAEGLKEAEELFKKLERQADQISKREDLTKKEALIALNDIKDQLQAKREQLGSPDEMRKSLANMKDMENGPAEKVVKAMEKGEFGEAKDQIKELADKLRDGSLTEEEKKKLAEQMNQMQKSMDDAIQKHEQEKQKLQEQIEQAKREGRTEEAAKLQEKLEQKQQMDGQMQQLKEMAEAMQAAQQAMEKGDSQGAADAMAEMADKLGEMQAQMDQMDELQDAMDQLNQAKDQMGCKQCNGQGCKDCQGQGQGDGEGEGDGLGKGNGKGDRPEEATDTNSYDSQVRGQPKQGRAVMAGPAGGENKKGITRESVSDRVLEAISEESDPLENQALPRNEREHTQQYFDRLREGK